MRVRRVTHPKVYVLMAIVGVVAGGVWVRLAIVKAAAVDWFVAAIFLLGAVVNLAWGLRARPGRRTENGDPKVAGTPARNKDKMAG